MRRRRRNSVFRIREGDRKKYVFVPNNGWVGVRSPKLFSENTHSVICTANIQTETYNTIILLSGEVISGHFMMI